MNSTSRRNEPRTVDRWTVVDDTEAAVNTKLFGGVIPSSPSTAQGYGEKHSMCIPGLLGMFEVDIRPGSAMHDEPLLARAAYVMFQVYPLRLSWLVEPPRCCSVYNWIRTGFSGIPESAILSQSYRIC